MNYKNVKAKPLNSPIEFKEINPSDFLEAYQVEEEKIIISPDSNGYIGNQIRDKIDMEQRNTVVINAGVGQGKSSECINIAIEFLKQIDEQGKNKYVILFVAPFKTLVNQNEERLLAKGVAQAKIFNYINISNGNVDIKAVSKLPIHILTINALIGNYGDDGFIQAKIKRNYLSLIIKHCEKERKKVVLIFDEMHESIHLFQEKYIFNLWKWYHILHKSFILSATYTEASKVVIKYLAEITNDKIQIIETQRLKHPEQSRLHLCLNNQVLYTAEDDKIAYLIEEECKKGKHVHILCYSEKLAKSIAIPEKQPDGELRYSKIGNTLKSYYEINLCTGDESNKFDEIKCNVGTTFKTGISINDENVSFFIITPHLKAYEGSFNKFFGIFTDGINSIIQAVARVRKGNNDIFIVMPSPQKLIKNSDRNKGKDNYMNYTWNVSDLRKLAKSTHHAEYYSLESQYKLLHNFYDHVICDFAKPGIKNFNMRYIHEGEGRHSSKPRLEFTTQDLFILEDGDRFLASGYEIFGSDISAYIVWAAYNNQFVNTTLSSVYFEGQIILNEGKIIEGLLKIYYNMYGMPYNEEFIAEKTLYDRFYGYITSTLKVSVIMKNGKKIAAKKSSLIKKGIITIIQHIKRVNEKFERRIYPKGEVNEEGKVRKSIDFFIHKEMYLQAAIANSINDLATNRVFMGIEKERVEGYQMLYRYANDLRKIIVFKDSNNNKYIPMKSFFMDVDIISDDLIFKLLSAIKDIRRTDNFINDETFSFCQWADKITTNDVKGIKGIRTVVLGKLIDAIRNLLFEASKTSKPQSLVTNDLGQSYKLRIQTYKISSEIDFQKINAVNLVYTSMTPWLESNISEGLKIALELN